MPHVTGRELFFTRTQDDDSNNTECGDRRFSVLSDADTGEVLYDD